MNHDILHIFLHLLINSRVEKRGRVQHCVHYFCQKYGNYIPTKHCEFPRNTLNLVIQTRIWPDTFSFSPL